MSSLERDWDEELKWCIANLTCMQCGAKVERFVNTQAKENSLCEDCYSLWELEDDMSTEMLSRVTSKDINNEESNNYRNTNSVGFDNMRNG